MDLCNLVLIKDILEVLGATSVMQAVLVVGETVVLNSFVFLSDVLLVLHILSVKLLHFLLEFFLELFNNIVLFIDLFVLFLMEGLINFDKFLVKLSAAETALFELALQHFLLTVLVVKQQVFNTLHLVFKLIHHILGVFFLLAVTDKALLECLATIISRLNLHF